MDDPRETEKDNSGWHPETLVDGQSQKEQIEPRASKGNKLVAGESCRPGDHTKLKGDTVSGFAETRDSLRALVLSHREEEEVELVELGFQPSRR